MSSSPAPILASCPPPAWWSEARFGLFIHWGVYSVPAGVHEGRRIPGASEWIMQGAKIRVADYKPYAAGLTAEHYDPEAWVRAALDAGMGYVVVGAKHHEGFALFDTAVNDWNARDATPAARDLLRPLVEACRRAGLPIGFYYSQAQDWINGGSTIAGTWDSPAQDRDFDDYLDRVAIPQLRELLTNYGPGVPACLWWDTPSQMSAARAARVNAAVQALAPGILQNDRLGEGHPGHFETPEQRVPARRPARAWETCMTTNESWGFSQHDEEWKPHGLLIRQLCEVVSQGGNYLLNVGPRPDGSIPEPTLAALRAIGAWMRVNGPAIRGASAGPFPYRLDWGFATARADKLYLLVEKWPADGRLSVPLFDRPASARLLAAPERALECEPVTEGAFALRLPGEAPDAAVSVVELHYATPPRLGEVPPLPRPPIIPQPADGAITLRSGDAEILGEHLVLLRVGAETPLGTWTQTDSWPLWRVRVHQAGAYRVEVEYALPAHRKGALVHFEIGEQTRPFVVGSSGSWSDFIREEVGVVALRPHEELPVRIVPRQIPLGAVMNLRAVHLIPTAA